MAIYCGIGQKTAGLSQGRSRLSHCPENHHAQNGYVYWFSFVREKKKPIHKIQKFRQGVGGQRGLARGDPSHAKGSDLVLCPFSYSSLRKRGTPFWGSIFAVFWPRWSPTSSRQPFSKPLKNIHGIVPEFSGDFVYVLSPPKKEPTPPKNSGTEKRGFLEAGFCRNVSLSWLWRSECQTYCWAQYPWVFFGFLGRNYLNYFINWRVKVGTLCYLINS